MRISASFLPARIAVGLCLVAAIATPLLSKDLVVNLRGVLFYFAILVVISTLERMIGRVRHSDELSLSRFIRSVNLSCILLAIFSALIIGLSLSPPDESGGSFAFAYVALAIVAVLIVAQVAYAFREYRRL